MAEDRDGLIGSVAWCRCGAESPVGRPILPCYATRPMPRSEKTTKQDEQHHAMVRAKLLDYGLNGDSAGAIEWKLAAAVLDLAERVAALEKAVGIRARRHPADHYLQSETSSRSRRRRKLR
jgi:hypothetical protein